MLKKKFYFHLFIIYAQKKNLYYHLFSIYAQSVLPLIHTTFHVFVHPKTLRSLVTCKKKKTLRSLVTSRSFVTSCYHDKFSYINIDFLCK